MLNDRLDVHLMKARNLKGMTMYEGNQLTPGAGIGQYNLKQDPMMQMTCGENIERKIAEQKVRLADLETALEEMKTTGLYNVKIATLRDTMTW
jgi:hypothetical protein